MFRKPTPDQHLFEPTPFRVPGNTCGGESDAGGNSLTAVYVCFFDKEIGSCGEYRGAPAFVFVALPIDNRASFTVPHWRLVVYATRLRTRNGTTLACTRGRVLRANVCEAIVIVRPTKYGEINNKYGCPLHGLGAGRMSTLTGP